MDENNMPFATDLPRQEPRPSLFPTGKREQRLFWCLLVLGAVLVDFLLYGGFYLAFGVVTAASVCLTAAYLLRSGHRLTGYSAALLLFSVVICLSFGRSNDGFVKFVMLQFLFFSVNLGLCRLAGKTLFPTEGLSSLVDAFRTVFYYGFGMLGRSCKGLRAAGKAQGAGAKKRSALLVGLLLAVPLAVALCVLLARADAAFEGLLDLLPEMDLGEPVAALLWGLPLGVLLYSRAAGLCHGPKAERASKKSGGMNPITVNTVLSAVCLVYGVYLFSQLAYFSGGFSGILPQDFTLADYARRGFFEMAWLCAIDLGIISLAVALTRGQGRSPLSTRLLCLFIGVLTLFFTVAASAKMLLYINAFGLTRLRVLTEVIMVFLALSTVFVCLWLLLPKLAYMKTIVLTALALGSLVAWVDVDTVVARYNVDAYLSGQLETVDVSYLSTLSDGAVPQIARLLEADNEYVVKAARQALSEREGIQDFREWNYATWEAEEYIKNNG